MDLKTGIPSLYQVVHETLFSLEKVAPRLEEFLIELSIIGIFKVSDLAEW